MKKFLIILFVFMAVFIMPSFASPTGGGDILLEFTVSGSVDCDFTIAVDQVVPVNTQMDFIFIENIVPVGRSKMHILSGLSAIETNIQLRAVEELMLRKTTMNELSGNLIRYVRLSA